MNEEEDEEEVDESVDSSEIGKGGEPSMTKLILS